MEQLAARLSYIFRSRSQAPELPHLRFALALACSYINKFSLSSISIIARETKWENDFSRLQGIYIKRLVLLLQIILDRGKL
jgi:hypothetical protein